jgi:hypothetical protein
MFDLAAPIVPGKSAAGIKLGQSIDEIIKSHQPVEILPLGDEIKYCFHQIDLWVKHDKVVQIGVKLDYLGSIQNKISIGSTINDVQLAFGKVIEDEEDNLVVPNIFGWCFETEIWQNGHKIDDNLISQITEIFIYGEDLQTEKS